MQHKEEILRLRSEGKSYREIQAILGCSKGTIAYHLGPGQKDKTKDRTNRTRTRHSRKLWELKESSGCIDCGEKYPHYMLEFDHLPGHKKLGSPVEVARSYSMQKALEEIQKCDIVCANCHRRKTAKQFGWTNKMLP